METHVFLMYIEAAGGNGNQLGLNARKRCYFTAFYPVFHAIFSFFLPPVYFLISDRSIIFPNYQENLFNKDMNNSN